MGWYFVHIECIFKQYLSPAFCLPALLNIPICHFHHLFFIIRSCRILRKLRSTTGNPDSLVSQRKKKEGFLLKGKRIIGAEIRGFFSHLYLVFCLMKE